MSYAFLMSITFNRYMLLLEELQAGVHKSANELADALGIHQRSVRRYVEELRLLGYDIRSERGPQGGYTFLGNVYLPPMNFTDNEALALSYGLLLLKSSPELAKASETALARLEPVLPPTIRAQTLALKESVNIQNNQPIWNAPSHNLIQLSQAIQKKQQIHIRYHTPDKAPEERNFDPYAIAHMIGLWFVAGYCHLRQDMRIFRVDRISKLEITEEQFAPPKEFDVLKYVSEGIARTNRHDSIEVIIDLEISLEEAQKRMPPGRVVIQEIKTGVRTTAFVKSLDQVVRFLATSSYNFKIVQPAELKPALKKHLKQVLEKIS